MRSSSFVALALCLASPTLAKTVTLAPSVSASFVGEIPEGYDPEGGGNCGMERSGPVLWWELPPGEGTIGNMGGYFYADDWRANFEFDLSNIKKKRVKKATIRFSADDEYGDGQSDNCLFTYIGDGNASLEDYMPDDKAEIYSFWMEWENETGSYGLDGAFDITALVNSMLKDHVDFLGFQFVTDNYADTIIGLSGVRIDIVPVEEPAGLALFGLGLVGLGMRQRQRRL